MKEFWRTIRKALWRGLRRMLWEFVVEEIGENVASMPVTPKEGNSDAPNPFGR